MSDNQKTKLEWALYYQKMGLSIIPTKPDKKPYLSSWKEFQVKPATAEQIMEWWSTWKDANPALVTGKVSNIVALDLDVKHNRTSKEFNIPVTASARSGNNGEHFFFKQPQGIRIETKAAIFGPGVDIRGEGGYILLSPSVNDKGGVYEWLVLLEDGLADMPDWLLERTQLQEKKWLMGSVGVTEGSRNETAASLAGKLLKAFPQDQWEQVAFPLLQGWNGSNTPPLPINELRRTFESIVDLELRNRVDTPQNIQIGEPVSMSQLLSTEFPEARFVVEQLFEKGTINMLSAPPNKYKSWVVILCAISVSSGRELFGKFKTEKQSVLIVNEEDNARLLQERCQMLLETHEELPLHFYICKQIKLEEKFIDQLLETVKKNNIEFIIFDSLRSVHDADENSSQEMQKIMNQLKKITRTGVTVLFTHHNRKKSRFGNSKDDSGEESRGSSAINAALHGHLSCDEVERDGTKYLVIHQPKLKAAAKIQPFEIRIENNHEQKKMRFIYEGEYKSQERIVSQTREKLLRVFDENSEWLTVKDLVALGVGGDTTIRTALRILESQRLIQATTRKSAEKSNLPIRDREAKHNAKLYAQINDEEEIEPMPSSLDF